MRFEHDAASGVSLDEVIRGPPPATGGALPLLSFPARPAWQAAHRRPEILLPCCLSGGCWWPRRCRLPAAPKQMFHAQLEAAYRELVRAAAQALVTIEGVPPASVPFRSREFAEGTPLRLLVDAFLDPEARLMVSDGDLGRPQLRLAHEALLTHWPRARQSSRSPPTCATSNCAAGSKIEAGGWRRAPRREKATRVRPARVHLGEARALLARWAQGRRRNSRVHRRLAPRRAASRCAFARLSRERRHRWRLPPSRSGPERCGTACARSRPRWGLFTSRHARVVQPQPARTVRQ